MLFKCVRSGRTMEVNDPEDIVQMKTNESYVIVEASVVSVVSAHSQGDSDGLRKETEEVPVKNADSAPKVKKLGRQRKEFAAPAVMVAVVEQVQPAVEQDCV